MPVHRCHAARVPRHPVTGPRRTPALLGAVALSVALAACGPQPGTGSEPPPVVTAPSSAPTGTTAPLSPSGAGDCPGSGLTVSVGPVDAALGLRAVTLTVLACGTGPATVEGYPALRLLDEEKDALDVAVVQEPDPVGGSDGPPVAPVVLQPGGSARAVLLWRNTVEAPEDDAPGSSLAVTATPGVPEQVLPLAVDLGSTARLTVGPWRPAA